MNPLLLLAAIAPSLLICFLIYFLDKHEKEGYLPLFITFVLGILSGFPAVGLQLLASNVGLDSQANLAYLLFYVFVVVAFSEELLKLFMVYIYPYKQSFFNEPMDGIVYMVMAGMGFALIENVIYAYSYGMETILVRAFTAVPAHAVFAALMGYFLGLSKFHIEAKWKLIGFGFFVAVFIHGLYDFFILQQYYNWLMGFGLITIIVGIYLSWLLIRDHRDNSPFKVTLDSEKVNGRDLSADLSED